MCGAAMQLSQVVTPAKLGRAEREPGSTMSLQQVQQFKLPIMPQVRGTASRQIEVVTPDGTSCLIRGPY